MYNCFKIKQILRELVYFNVTSTHIDYYDTQKLFMGLTF